MVKETELEGYYRQIEKALGSNESGKAQILKNAKCDMEEFLEEFPDATMEDLVKRFGTPEDYVKEYVSGLDSGELTRKLNVAQFWKKAITIGVSAVVVIALFIAVLVVHNNTSKSTRYYDEDIVNVTTSPIEEDP